MDLYGGLPPAQGDELPTPSAPPKIQHAANQVAAEKIKMIVKSTPKVSSSLAFKPRQTAPSSHTIRAPVISSQPKESATPIEPSQKELPAVHQITTIAANRTQNEEFNSNSSYDVSNAYDPKQPNDYIAYCEERLERRKQLRLHEENARHMQAAEEARTQLEQDRRDAAQRGDYQSLLSSVGAHPSENSGVGSSNGGSMGSGGSMGRGRGRGLNNLPAWMTQMATEGAASTTNNNTTNNTTTNTTNTTNNTTNATSTHTAVSEQFTDATALAAAVVGIKRKQQGMSKPSCVLLLKNMVAAAEVDEQLPAETMQECLKYGPVNSCQVHTVAVPGVQSREQGGAQRCPEDERVRTFVEFERQDSAIRAFRDLNGRFFAGRQISASFYPEQRYRQHDLAPDTTEQAMWVNSSV